MGSFTAMLRVAGQQYGVVHFTTVFTQAADARGRITAKVRHGALDLELDVPPDDHLLQWAATAHKALAGELVVLDATGKAHEYVQFGSGYCVRYQEVFRAGNRATGAYRCHLRLTDPAGFRLGSGDPAALAPPAARGHGTPPVAAAAGGPAPLPGTVSTCPPDVTARLQSLVNLACKAQKSKCTGENSCIELAARIPAAKACIAAREAIMQQCYGGGDADHKEEVRRRKEGLKYCEELYLKKCGPFPQPDPIPQSVPNRQPVPETQPHKPNPIVPVGVGALLLYYLLETLEAIIIAL